MDELTTVVFEGQLLKQNRHGQFQKRMFRFDGLLLLCLAPTRQLLPENITLLTFDPLRHANNAEFADALRRFYPTNPPMPALTNPLLASYETDDDALGSHITTKYYHMPKWIIPTSTIISIRTLVPQPPKDPDSKLSRTFIIETIDREYVLRAPTAELFNRWTFLLSRMSATPDSFAIDPSHHNDSFAEYDDEQNINDDHDEDDAKVESSASEQKSTQAVHDTPFWNQEPQQSFQPPKRQGSLGTGSVNQSQLHSQRDSQILHYQQLLQQSQPFPLQQPQQQQFVPVNSSIDVTHEAIPRLETWNRSVAELMDRDAGARGSIISISANIDQRSDATPSVLRGGARRSFLGDAVVALQQPPIDAISGRQRQISEANWSRLGSVPPGTSSHPPSLTSLTPPLPPAGAIILGQTVDSPTSSQPPNQLPLPSIIGARTTISSPTPSTTLPLSRPGSSNQSNPPFPPSIPRTLSSLPRPQEVPQREISHATTAIIRLIRRLQGFPNDSPSAKPTTPPSPAFIIEFACEAIPHQLSRIHIRIQERLEEVLNVLSSAAAAPSRTAGTSYTSGYENVIKGLEGTRDRVQEMQQDWDRTVVQVLKSASASGFSKVERDLAVENQWRRVLGVGICGGVVDVMQDVRRFYC
ncbi:hypothetical protein BDR26DRAFT_48443 [Obelidium mucronatum]|nr:hypothetical protein BDR26DRAFT_48443 [Obelidium mucronatum]